MRREDFVSFEAWYEYKLERDNKHTIIKTLGSEVCLLEKKIQCLEKRDFLRTAFLCIVVIINIVF